MSGLYLLALGQITLAIVVFVLWIDLNDHKRHE